MRSIGARGKVERAALDLFAAEGIDGVSIAEIAAAAGVSAKARLANNDGYGFFSAIGDLVVTGPTLTNVNDFRAVLVLG